MARKGNRILIKLFNAETGEFTVREFHRLKIDVATYQEKRYSPKLKKHAIFKAKKLK